MKADKKTECNRTTRHRYIPKRNLEMPMQNSDYDQINLYRDGVKVCLEFPVKKKAEEENIKNTIKNILKSALQEQLQMSV